MNASKRREANKNEGGDDHNDRYFLITVTLRGDSLPLNKVESILGFKADTIGKKGEHRKNNPKYAKYKTNISPVLK